MEVKDWLSTTLAEHGHLPRRKVIELAEAEGMSETTVERTARRIGVMVQRHGRESEWYPPGTQEAEIPVRVRSTTDHEVWLITELYDQSELRPAIYRRARKAGFSVASINKAADILKVEEKTLRSHGRRVVQWSLPITGADAFEQWKTRRKVLVPLGA